MKITIPENKRFETPETEYECSLIDDGTLDTVIQIDTVEHRFSTEFASHYRDDEGYLSDKCFRLLCEMAIEEDERHWS
jgi:hypothetical protein